MQEWYSIRSLAERQLAGLPVSIRKINQKAANEHWQAQQRLDQGGGWEYHISSLPKEAREELQQKHCLDVLHKIATTGRNRMNVAPVRSLLGNSGHTTFRQRKVASSRVMVLEAIKAMIAEGLTQEGAIETLLVQAQCGELSNTYPVLESALAASVDSRGKSGSGKSYPNRRTIMRWLSDAQHKQSLVPMVRQKDPIPSWLSLFRKFYNVPEKPSFSAAYDIFQDTWSINEQPIPSIYAVRRAFNKLGKVEREKGRIGSHELVNIRPFVRRSFKDLFPGDVYSADGHTFDGEVSHPLHGRPFRPEITTFIDIATRRVVGVSVTLAESGLAVLDALMDSCKQGVPALIYVDNGSGYANHMLKDESKGVLARLGSEMTHSLPYNSKARGVIERVHQTLWVAGAKSLPNYVGKDMDRQARLDNYTASRRGIQKDGKVTTLSWVSFMEWVNGRVDWYNKRPHSSLSKIQDAGSIRHQTPLEVWLEFVAKGWQPTLLDNDDIADIFRPREERTVVRGEIRLFNNRYFSNELEEFHGMSMHVAYDIQDPQFVWVFHKETGHLICKAEWNGNEASYFPESVLNQAREKRAKGRLSRVMNKMDEIEAERTGNLPLESVNTHSIEGTMLFSHLQGQFDLTQEVDRRQPVDRGEDWRLEKTLDIEEYNPFSHATEMHSTSSTNAQNDYANMAPETRFELYKHCQQHSNLSDQHQGWLAKYPFTKEFLYFQRRESEEDR